MMDNGGGMGLVYFAIIVVFVGTVVFPAVITSIIVLIIKIFKRKLSRQTLLILWVIGFLIVSIILWFLTSVNSPLNKQILIKTEVSTPIASF